LKKKKRAKTRGQSKNRPGGRAAKPRNVWHSLRKLENYLRKADLQADIFMESLNELRDAIAFEIKTEFIKKLCSSVHGDLLGALWNYRKEMEDKQAVDGANTEAGVILLGIFEVLMQFLDLHPHRCGGDRFVVTRESAKQLEFDEVPRKLDDERGQEIEVEVLRCGWKIGEKVIQKPRVFEVSSS
jgi:hypothetical protein